VLILRDAYGEQGRGPLDRVRTHLPQVKEQASAGAVALGHFVLGAKEFDS